MSWVLSQSSSALWIAWLHWLMRNTYYMYHFFNPCWFHEFFSWDLVMPAAPSTHSWILHALYYKNSSRYSTTSMQTECIFWQVWLSPNLTKKRREWSHSYLDTMASFRIFYPEKSIHGYFTYISVLLKEL